MKSEKNAWRKMVLISVITDREEAFAISPIFFFLRALFPFPLLLIKLRKRFMLEDKIH